MRQRAYVIYDAIIYSKRPLLRLRPLLSNNELSAVKAHLEQLKSNLKVLNYETSIIYTQTTQQNVMLAPAVYK